MAQPGAVNTIRLYGSGSATANGVAQIIIPSKTRLRGVQCATSLDCSTDNGMAIIEVSRSSSKEIQVNGSQQAIVEVQLYNNFVTSGMSAPNFNGFLPCDVSVNQGQIIYLHAVVTGTMNYYATFIIHYA